VSRVEAIVLAVKLVHLLAGVVWVGGVVFFSFVAAPRLFQTLPREEAGRAVSAIFPTYYMLGYVCGTLLIVTALVLFAAGRNRRWLVSGVVGAVMLGSSLYAGMVVQPRAHALRSQLAVTAADAPVHADFDRLHRLAVQLNGVVLIGGLLITGIAAGSIRE
jgi:uncharacterized membrane protein